MQHMIALSMLQSFTGGSQHHADTRFDHWFAYVSWGTPSHCSQPAHTSRSFEGDLYDIQPKRAGFEPWIILDTRLALRHPYDEAFRGFVSAFGVTADDSSDNA